MGGFIIFIIVVALISVGAVYFYTKEKLKDCTSSYEETLFRTRLYKGNRC